VVISLLFLLPLLVYLPKVTMSSIVIVAASRLIEFDFVFQWRV
jgi:MFS superfamily sulfate permease-like transporter